MIHDFRWRISAVRALLAELAGGAAFAPSYSQQDAGEPGVPALVFVKDEGTYLMTNRADHPEGAMRLVEYAEGYDPKKVSHEQWWTGGDDFAEHLPAEEVERLIEGRSDEAILGISIDLQGTTFEIYVEGR